MKMPGFSPVVSTTAPPLGPCGPAHSGCAIRGLSPPRVVRRTSHTSLRSKPRTRAAEGLGYGIVGINQGIISLKIAAFGGIKERSIGREGSKYGIEEFLEVKYLCMGGIDR